MRRKSKQLCSDPALANCVKGYAVWYPCTLLEDPQPAKQGVVGPGAMSVRSRIEKFEQLSKDEEDSGGKKEDTSKRSGHSKRFQFPGNNTLKSGIDSHTDVQNTGTSFITTSRSPKRNTFQDYEADLQEVWSVRKNIHHSSGPQQQQQIIPSSNSATGLLNQANKAGLYSRHRAIAAQPTRGSQVQPVARDNFSRGSKHHSGMETSLEHSQEQKRIPLQDFNSKESPWNVKKGNYSYNFHATEDGVAKRPIGSPKATEPSLLPAAKRRINFGTGNVMKTTSDHRAPQLRGSTEIPGEKTVYAKKMAEGYLRSMGMGEFTPKSDMYSKEEAKHSKSDTSSSRSDSVTRVTKWKRMDDDQEFDFDI